MAGKSNGTDMADWVRAPPPSGPFLQRVARAIYNPKEKSFLGRTPKRWGIVITFYLVFYAVLALMFALCMGGLFLSLHNDRPTYTLDQSLIGSNPGVTARPLPEKGELMIDRDDANSTSEYVEQLKEFFQPYAANDSWYSKMTECVPEDNFGYPDTPCLLVKLNRILDWEPHYYDDAHNLPEDFPTDLVDHIKALETPAERARLWVWCWDEAGAGGAGGAGAGVSYPWGRALPGYLPFRTGVAFNNPILAVKLTQVSEHTVIRCRILAKNIIYDKSIKEPSGYARVVIHSVGGDTKHEAGDTEHEAGDTEHEAGDTEHAGGDTEHAGAQ